MLKRSSNYIIVAQCKYVTIKTQRLADTNAGRQNQFSSDLFSPRVGNQEVQYHRAEVQNHKVETRNPKRQNGSITLGIKTRNNAGTLTEN